MDWQDSTNGFKSAPGKEIGRHLRGTTSLAEPPESDQPLEPDELDDGVEALIIHMDRTTAEHLFLRAQRRY
jgi:hypothetical protein